MLLQLIHHLLNTSFFKPLIDADNGIFKDVKRAVPLKKIEQFLEIIRNANGVKTAQCQLLLI